MTKTEIGALSCKLLGIYAFIASLMTIQFPVALLQPAFSQQASRLIVVASFIPTILLLVFGMSLWLGSNRLQFTSNEDSDSKETISGITPAILQSIASR